MYLFSKNLGVLDECFIRFCPAQPTRCWNEWRMNIIELKSRRVWAFFLLNKHLDPIN